MKNFNQKLEDIETNIINERTNKKLTDEFKIIYKK